MRSEPTLETTITTYNNSGVSVATEWDVFNYATNSVSTQSGGATLSIVVVSENSCVFRGDAGTSFVGSNGDTGRFRLGVQTTDFIILDAEL